MSILIKNAKILYQGRLIKKNILIAAGKIKKISSKEKTADEVIDIRNSLVLPGLIDVHTHMREPGLAYKEDFLTGSKAAAAGGITTILDMPNTIPPTITKSGLDEKRALAKKSIVNYGFHFGCVDDNLSEIMKVRNIASVKAYLGASTGNLTISNQSLEKLFKGFNNLITVHAEDEECLKEYEGKYQHIAEFHNSLRAKICAIKAVKTALDLAKMHKTPLHIAHISTKEEVELISKAKESGINATCEVTPHHLFLSSENAKTQENFVKVNPPLRASTDVKALWRAVSNNKIEIVASDHAPHTIAEKKETYDIAPAGVPGLETMLPLLLDAYNKKRITLQTLINMTSFNPAGIFKIKNKALIKEGYDADLVVVELKMAKKVKNDLLFTKCGWSPFDGRKLKGWPVMTFVNGNLIYDNGTLIDIKAGEVNYYE